MKFKLMVNSPETMKSFTRKMKAVENFLFDFDDTLTNTKLTVIAAITKLLVTNNIPTADIVRILPRFQKINASYWKKYEKRLISSEDVRNLRFKDLHQEFEFLPSWCSMSSSYLDFFKDSTIFADGAHELLTFLQTEKKKVFIITNGFEAIQRHRLSEMNLLPLIDGYITSEKFGAPKPNPDVINYAIQKLAGDKETTVMIGDSLNADISSALQAGIMSIHVSKQQTYRGKIAPTASVASLPAFLEWYKSTI